LEELQQSYPVSEEQIGQRLDRFLAPILDDLSRNAIQQLITSEAVLVNSKASKPGYALRKGDTITITRSTPTTTSGIPAPNELPLDVLYEDEYLFVLNKAPGMVVHPAPGHSDDTLVNALLARYPELQDVGTDGRPGIVHRLDKDTSGLIIIARNSKTLTALMEQMQRHEIVKRYLALVEGNVAHEQGSIDAPIGRDTRNRQQMTVTTRDSREARTHFRILQRFSRHTLLLLQLETGRTHQIRVHLKAIGHPVVGDPVYGTGKTPRGITLNRQFLHAYQLQFQHPITGKLLEIEAPLPKDLQNILDKETIL
jgi:23S rRNA pseudouridine1911/1915/1917 synthase